MSNKEALIGISKIIGRIKSKFYSIEEPDKLLEFINDNIKPTTENKKSRGEVFTPMTLVNEMLDKLPKEVWTNKNLKWLDPAAGMGNFPIAVYLRLFKSLKQEIKDDEDRRKHILEEMLYMVEIDKYNVFMIKKILCGHKYKLNIFEGSFIEGEKYPKVYKPDLKFDVIMGNPPYQANQIAVNKRGGGDLIWNKFIIKSLDILLTNKYLLLVTPSGWRKPESEKSKYKNLFKIMTFENQMLYLEIHNTKDGIKIFSSGTRYDIFLIKKTKQYKITIVKDEKGIISNMDLSKWFFLPNFNFNFIKKLLSTKNNNNVIYSTTLYETRKKWVSKIKTIEFKYPLIHSTPITGIRYMYSSVKNKGHFGVSKIIFGESGINNIIIDITGKYGLTQEAIGIKIKNFKEGTEFKKALESNKFKNVLIACSWSNFRIDWRLFTYFKEDFYKYF